MHCRRLIDSPIVSPGTPGWDKHAVGHNINGPSLIGVPDWVDQPLGRYYLYFAHHHGKSIRLAVADALTGPWWIHTPGTLRLEQTPFTHHIASPDVHPHPDGSGRLAMIYHGHGGVTPAPDVEQPAAVAVSDDGVHWTHESVLPVESYLRAFHVAGRTLGVAKGGRLAEAPAGTFEFVSINRRLDISGRHWAVLVDGDRLHAAYSRWGDAPEHLVHMAFDSADQLDAWNRSPRTALLTPDRPWEGGDLPIHPSRAGTAHHPVRELRDPAFFRDADGRAYLVYSTAGEAGLGIAALII
ncbi:MAG: hypothetical protein AAGI54_00860 [Planctomycetota bacterium]